MEWSSLVLVLIGGVLAIGGGAVQQLLAGRRADAEWTRNLRFSACVRVLSSYQSFTDALFYSTDEWDPYVDGPRPDPLPSFGEAERNLREAVDELQIVGPPGVAEAAQDLLSAAEDYRGVLGEEQRYSHWGRHQKLRHRFLVEAISATGNHVQPPAPFKWQDWNERFKALDDEK